MNKYTLAVIVEYASDIERITGTVESKLGKEEFLHYISNKIRESTDGFFNLHEVDEWCRIDNWHAIPINRIAGFYVKGA